MSAPDLNKYMEGNITGWTAYLALEKVLKRWYEISGEPYAEWLYTSLRSDPALKIDWADAMREAIEERGEGNSTELLEVFPEEYKETREKLARKIEKQYNQMMKKKEQK